MPSRTHEYTPGAQYGCWTVIREADPVRKSWGLQRKVLARCRCGVEKEVFPKMLHRGGAYCKACNPGRQREKTYDPGDVYGPWTVIKEIEGRQYPSGDWARQILVRCKCGNEVVVVRAQLRNSTRCQRCTRSVEIAVGQRFGDLVVVATEIAGRQRWAALLRCDCGTEVEVRPAMLQCGNNLSCGCRRRRKGAANPRWGGHGQLSGQKWKNYRNGAKHRGIPFRLTIAQAWDIFEKQEGRCALSGLPIEFVPGTGTETTASLDRIDSTRSYTPSNVQWVHKDINRMKGALPEDRFTELCRAVADHRAVAATDEAA